MSTPHRATEQQWEIVEICREQGHTPWPTATYLLELRSRMEALEKVIRVITGSLTPAEQAELGVVSVKDLQADLRSIAFEAMKAAKEAATKADNATAATVAEIRSLLFKDAAPDAPAAQPEPPTFQESQARKAHYEAELARLKCEAMQQPASVAPPPLRCPGAHTIAECGGPCEDDFRLCDCGLLQQLNPAGGLVERVAGRLSAACGLQDGQWDEAAIDVLREVADWLRENDSEREMGGDAAATADLIEHEASR